MNRFWLSLYAAIGFGALALFAVPARGDAPAWMHTAAGASLPTYDEKTNAVLIYSEDIVTVIPNGRKKRIERRVFKILRPEGREFGVAWGYVSQDSKIGSMRGWCIPKQGKDYEVKDKDAMEKSLAIYNGELASDLKVRYFTIPAAEPGNVVGYEIQYDGMPFVLEDVWSFQREVAVKETRYTLQMPPGWEYKASWLNHPKIEPTASGGNQWQWVLNDLPALRPEAHMPPFQGVSGRRGFRHERAVRATCGTKQQRSGEANRAGSIAFDRDVPGDWGDDDGAGHDGGAVRVFVQFCRTRLCQTGRKSAGAAPPSAGPEIQRPIGD
jgi:hypothetical protein